MKRICIGDSHILCLREYTNSVYQYSGSSLSGLVKDQSTSNARKDIINRLYKNTYDEIYIMFGKVDMEWVYPYKKALDNNLERDVYMNETIGKYIKFLKDLEKLCLSKKQDTKVIILGIHPPSLESKDMLICINNHNSVKNVKGKSDIENNTIPIIEYLETIEERTKDICLFNKKLEEGVSSLNNSSFINYKFVSIDDKIIKDGKVKDEYKTGKDHHLSKHRVGKIWNNILNLS